MRFSEVKNTHENVGGTYIIEDSIPCRKSHVKPDQKSGKIFVLHHKLRTAPTP
jgi:hypothetical protein